MPAPKRERHVPMHPVSRRPPPAWVAPATASHVEDLAPRMRGQDRREIEAAFGRPAEAILRSGFRNARRCWTVLGGGRPVAMFGVGRRRAPRIGTAWLLASDGFLEFRGQLRREGHYWVEVLMVGHDVLANFVAADNATAIRWLSWLGFEMLALHRGIGTKGEDFWEFAAFRPGTRERYLTAVPRPSTGAAGGTSPAAAAARSDPAPRGGRGSGTRRRGRR